MRRIRLTEGQLHNVIRESVNNILNEISDELKAKAWAKAKKLGRKKQAAYFAGSEGSRDDNGVLHGAGFVPDFNDKYARKNKYFQTYAYVDKNNDDDPTLISREHDPSYLDFYKEYKEPLRGNSSRINYRHDYTINGEENVPITNNDYDYDSNIYNRPAYANSSIEWNRLKGYTK